MSRDSYIQHAHRHEPGGSDELDFPVGAPRVATFYRLGTDAPQSISPGAGRTLEWPNQELPSDGSITGASVLGGPITRLLANESLLTDEEVYVKWEDGTYQRAVVFGTNSRIITADRFGEANQGDGSTGADGSGKQWVNDSRKNGYINGDESLVYVQNGDAGARDVIEAYWVIYAWPAAGYLGGIPGYPL